MGKEKGVTKQHGYNASDLIILGTHIHCQGCAAEVIHSLRGFQGVEDVKVDSLEHRVTVKGKHADPLRVLERVRYKCKNKHVELIYPIPKPRPILSVELEPNKVDQDHAQPPVMIIVIKIFIHCENCAEETESCIKGMKGVHMVTVNAQKKDEITVIGSIEPQNLVDYLYRKARKHATIVKCEYQGTDKSKRRQGKQNINQMDSKQGDGDKKKKKDDNESVMGIYYQYPPLQYNPDPLYPCLLLNDENPHSCSII